MKKILLALAASLLGTAAFALTLDDQGAAQAAARADAQAAAQANAKTDAAVIADQLPSYPLTTCPLSGEDLGEEPVDVVVDGRLVRLCCADCVEATRKNPAKAFAKIDAAVIAAQKPGYPLDVCPISGEKLAEMDAPIDVVVGTRLVRVCCKSCVKAVRKDPAKALAPVNAALIAAQVKTYPTDQCLISGEPLGEMGEPIDLLYGTRLARLCCKGCVKGFKKDPTGFFAKLDAMKAKEKPEQG